MGANLDMNANRIVNLAAPVDDNDAVRLVDILEGTVVDDIVETILIDRLVAGDGVDVTIGGGNATLSLNGNYTKNLIGGILLDTSSVDMSYDPINRTISATVVTEAIQDIVGAMPASSDNFLTISYNDGAGTIGFTEGSGVVERVQDIAGAMMGSSDSFLSISYNDVAGTLDFIAGSGLTELVQDAVGAMTSSSDNFLTVTYDDGAGTLVLTEGSGVPERIRDVIGTAIQGTANEVTVTVDDGADTITLSLPAAQKKIRLGFFFAGLHTNDEILARYVALSAFDLPASLTGSYLKAATAATGSTTFSLKKNGVEFATCLVSAAGTTGAFTAASLTSFAAGDVLSIHAPASADATLADVGLSLIGDLT